MGIKKPFREMKTIYYFDCGGGPSPRRDDARGLMAECWMAEGLTEKKRLQRWVMNRVSWWARVVGVAGSPPGAVRRGPRAAGTPWRGQMDQAPRE